MLGISVYLKKDMMDQNAAWIEKAAQYGLNSIFTSLHIPEDNPAEYKELLQKLGQLAKKHSMELMADVSPRSLDYLGLEWEQYDELLQWGLSGIRADYGFTIQQIVELSHKMKIGINASTVTKEELLAWKGAGLNTGNVEAWHNFYPRPETGLDKGFLIERNLMFRSFGITTMAFVPGDKDLRGPVFSGLPTLEKHRCQLPHIAAAELMGSCFTDKILIGDHSVTDEQLELLAFLGKKIIPLRIEPESQEHSELMNRPLTNRMDPARDVIRAVESRSFASIGEVKIPPSNQHERLRGTITIDNELYGRYAGELQIAVNDLPQDEKVNCIGKVVHEDLPLLDEIKAGQKFHFIVRDGHGNSKA
ncbi:MupG family TIM beta-alpha barrel fold protein [Mesobacillus jeotgali]|uniref:MupG family TIM beta-alpha barrel fold protein n=1 Tax=Mesobacillus jeotgali TaxID=129985 RepID=A0ABY9VF29_9BACI|nr:MupG family TIM beta-alpha barrel fold protein [Mesobacillus jeotgali]WNF22534.1 MupG family TIM beta-alpha barrel fold protein [Mesobacillus jeotgali]